MHEIPIADSHSLLFNSDCQAISKTSRICLADIVVFIGNRITSKPELSYSIPSCFPFFISKISLSVLVCWGDNEINIWIHAPADCYLLHAYMHLYLSGFHTQLSYHRLLAVVSFQIVEILLMLILLFIQCMWSLSTDMKGHGKEVKDSTLERPMHRIAKELLMDMSQVSWRSYF